MFDQLAPPRSAPLLTPTSRRQLLALALASAAGASWGQARNKPIRLMATSSAGGGVDFSARLLAPRLAEELGTAVIVENKPGATGMICAQYVAKSPPDGTTLMIGAGSAVAVAPHLVDKPLLDPLNDLMPINAFGTTPLCIAVHPSLGVQTLPEFIALIKSKPVNIAHPGSGTVSHLCMELLNQAAGGKIVHVAYKGGGPSIVDALAGHVGGVVTDIAPIQPHIQERRLFPIAVTTKDRFELLPTTPTLSEAVPGFSAGSWMGLYAPVGTPQAFVDRVSAALIKIAASSDFSTQLKANGVVPGSHRSPAQFKQFVVEEHTRWGKLIKDKGITAG